MASRSSEVSCYQGRYHRTIGRWVNEQGKPVPKKFLLGTDRAAAEVANRLLERLWEEVVAEHENAGRFVRERSGRLGDVNALTGEVDHQRIRSLEHGPVWREESLSIAEAVRQGQRQLPVQVGMDAARPDAYVERIAVLQKTYTVIAFVPASARLYALGQESLAAEARSCAEQARELAAAANVPLPVAAGQTLYQALDAYGQYAALRNPKEAGQREAAAAQRLKAAHPDIALEQFGISSMERIAAYWAGRPIAKKTGKPTALNTITNHLKTARRFVRWLHRTDAFQWSRPVDAEEALRVDVERLRTDEEVSELRHGVPVWSIAELAVLYGHATDQDRLLMLLGLNCGFAHSEICSLRRDEIVRGEGPTTIKRIRRKNRVYGQFVLWPQTLAALDWFSRQERKQAAETHAAQVMITQQGRLFDRQRIANAWSRLLDRVQKDHPEFRRLSFKHLRKTAGQLVRERSDGELAGVFLCHGRAVVTDELADVYTNRPFGKVALVLEQVHRDLQPVFAAAAEAFSRPWSGGSPNITRGQIDRIRALRAGGVQPAEIADRLGLSRQTVYRWIGRSAQADG